MQTELEKMRDMVISNINEEIWEKKLMHIAQEAALRRSQTLL